MLTIVIIRLERAVLLTRGTVLDLQLPELNYPLAISAPTPPVPVLQEEDERERIVQVLKETNGVVAGPRGAACRLALKRTTLLSRMKKLGLKRNRGSGLKLTCFGSKG